MDIAQYSTLVFDCDGVILDSNRLKTQAYFDTAIAYGANAEQARAITDYHVRLGGVSRYPKFQYFLEKILYQPATEENLEFLLERFASEIHQGLLHCRVAEGLHELRASYPRMRWMVLSGSDQQELRRLFQQRGLDTLFDAGIFGSPDDKRQVLERELRNHNIKPPALFIGDSQYDHQVAAGAGLDFVFLSAWTEFAGWEDYCRKHDVPVRADVRALQPG